MRGAYLFLRFPHSKYNACPTPEAQAKAFILAVGKHDPTDLPPSLDVEFPGSRSETKMSAQQCLDGVRAAWRVLKDHYGVAPLIYTSARVWREDLCDLPAPDLVESPLWLARYPFKPGPAVRDPKWFAGGRNNPPVPPPWGDAGNWWIHQYQGDAVRLPGFPTGNLDMNRFTSRSPATPAIACGGFSGAWGWRRPRPSMRRRPPRFKRSCDRRGSAAVRSSTRASSRRCAGRAPDRGQRGRRRPNA